MTLEEFYKKKNISEADLYELTPEQMDTISEFKPSGGKNGGRGPFKMSMEQRLKLSLKAKEYWFKKKNGQ